MANEIITTLHPDQDPNIDLYPNVKKENIPNNSIDRTKLDYGVNALLDSINELKPSGVDTSTNILAFTTNRGIFIGSDTGYWYYWNGSQYVSGGVYQATQLSNESVTPEMTDFIYSKNIYDKDDTTNDNKLVSGANIVDYNYTGYIQFSVKNGDVIHFRNINVNSLGQNLGSFFNVDGTTFINNFVNGDRLTDLDYTMTFDAVLKINYAKATRDTFMIFINGVVPNFYVPYNKIIISNLFTNVKLLNKSLALDGDSICQGFDGQGGYGKIISKNNAMTYNNQSVGGGTIATGTYSGETPRHWISTNIDNMPKSNYVLIEGGINDYYNSVPLGTFDPNLEGDKTRFDTTTFYGALDYLFTTLIDEFRSQGCKIAFLIQHKVNRVYMQENSINLTYNDYYDAIINSCKKYAIPVIDLYKTSGFDTFFTSLKAYTHNSDGLHPTETGYKRYYVDQITSFLNSL